MKSLLVTGGAGMIGSHVAEHYAKAGWRVVILDTLIRSKLFDSDRKSVEYNWNYLERYSNVRRVRGDVRIADDVRGVVGDGVDAVVHAAGQPGVGYSIRNPMEDFSINALGTLQILECVRQVCPQAAFIYCSTNKVYGENVDRVQLRETGTRYEFVGLEAIPEDFPIDRTGHTPYGVSKYTGDLYVQEYARLYGLKAAVFRMSCIYGTRQFGFEDQGWVAWFVIAISKGFPLTIYGNGKQVRDALYVTDLIGAFDKFIQGPHRHAVYNMGGGPRHTTSLLELLERIGARLSRKPQVQFTAWRSSDQKVYVSDIRKAQAELGWSPTVSIEEGTARLIAWVQENPALF